MSFKLLIYFYSIRVFFKSPFEKFGYTQVLMQYRIKYGTQYHVISRYGNNLLKQSCSHNTVFLIHFLFFGHFFLLGCLSCQVMRFLYVFYICISSVCTLNCRLSFQICSLLICLFCLLSLQHLGFRSSVQFSSVAQLCPTLCDPMNCSTPGLPVHHHHPEFTQTHVHRVRDAIQPSHPGSSPSFPAPNPSQHQSLFQ